MNYLVLIVFMVLAQHVSADDFSQRSFILAELRKSAKLGKNFDAPFLSQFEMRREIGFFSNNSGTNAFSAPQRALSAYDPTVSYYLTDFYTSQKPRTRFFINQFIHGTNILLSGGFDSGSTASKINISKSFFLGLSGYKKIGGDINIYFTSGVWQKQRVTEQPCTDEYDRQYWCPTLTAWIDRPSTNFVPGKFIDLKIEYIFN